MKFRLFFKHQYDDGTFILEASAICPLRFVELLPFLVYSVALGLFWSSSTAGGQQLNPAFWGGGGKAINWNKSGGCKIVRAITEPIIIIFVECDGPVLVVGWFNVILGMLVHIFLQS